ncbi:phytoene dehydrogenase [Plectosphaerella plurivora]|uniref:Phytoene desaturase n=1 Tax=Plectosphaerella plurivora TaxID=936078 RepID=A0A9P8VL16_9PEZI|nr:phytoene dehydrogenase [Plectosphaerella plurivora]
MEKHAGKRAGNRSAIVIGAGAGGVATAARLAKSGFDVTVVEKNSFTGGRCSLIHHEGFRFDQGPSLFLLPQLFQETFRDLGTTMEGAGVDLLRCQGTNYNIWFHDGELFRHSSDLAVMKEEIERWEGKAGFARYLQWLREAHSHYEVSVSDVLHRNFTALVELARPDFLRHVITLHPLESIWSRASRYFWTERLRRVFTFATMYMGMSPFDAPATYSLLQYTEYAEGIWYPKGGFHKVIEALVKVGESLGVQYRLNTGVSRVLTSEDDSKATGVLLENGETLTADVVVVNADLVYAYSNLLPKTPSIKKYSRSLQKKEASCSSISFYWSVNRKFPELQTHNIFLAEEYRDSFDSIFKRHSLPTDPSFYVNVPSRVDPTAAPEGCESIIVLVPVGHLQQSKGGIQTSGLPTSETDWKIIVDRARAAVLATISSRTGCASIRDHITNEIVNTPLTWEDKFNLDKGAILGLSHSVPNVLAFRPRTRAEGLKNAYFVGASTHPGTGVPIVLAGAKITTEQILEDQRVGIPWTDSKTIRETYHTARKFKTEALDKMDPGFQFGSEEVAKLLGAIMLCMLFTFLWPMMKALSC